MDLDDDELWFTKYKRNYVSKDKIREKIRQFKAVKQEIFRLENKLGIPSITYDIVRNDYCEKMLEELLKE